MNIFRYESLVVGQFEFFRSLGRSLHFYVEQSRHFF